MKTFARKSEQIKTQRSKILALLVQARGAWVPLPDILALGIAQYNARIFELRRLGFAVENRPPLLVPLAAQFCRPTRTGESEVGLPIHGAPARGRSRCPAVVCEAVVVSEFLQDRRGGIVNSRFLSLTDLRLLFRSEAFIHVVLIDRDLPLNPDRLVKLACLAQELASHVEGRA
jgi:hypothetical protein